VKSSDNLTRDEKLKDFKETKYMKEIT